MAAGQDAGPAKGLKVESLDVLHNCEDEQREPFLRFGCKWSYDAREKNYLWLPDYMMRSWRIRSLNYL